ncbi:MAG: DUF2914 domain-containing protein [Gemmatimonadetes bacterium]|uniref:DUF2914 domain-containing protein n=1 Tax=Candidatus Kutchimonas denitrificans TaxID=3056748 RepID=A0AAE4ZA01_9BACT|nr:DUF2914 domain-containing protein [Gemmatimonadota bacterium]NIR76524.1 DUF2914 domain-containing protein [Candidatus Kutchimonas denitrificans]NIS03342.1 DUF2914 domain-containing protein [Gemmatimonadota bacterium]NIT69203.1 DUF2914 domain-containing protein [Gemmatimonadota bacterium]NIU54595.1 DUF2914 domain-containing protein [Gemmatimonadota bacterium]
MLYRNVALMAFAMLLGMAVAVSAQEPQEQQGQEEQPGLAVAEAVITADIVDRQPGGNLEMVDSDMGRVYCWTRITGAQEEITIEHVWYKGDVEMARVPLRIAGSNWRTWSSKNIEEIWTGPWHVDIVGPDGTVLETVEFTVE